MSSPEAYFSFYRKSVCSEKMKRYVRLVHDTMTKRNYEDMLLTMQHTYEQGYSLPHCLELQSIGNNLNTYTLKSGCSNNRHNVNAAVK